MAGGGGGHGRAARRPARGRVRDRGDGAGARPMERRGPRRAARPRARRGRAVVLRRRPARARAASGPTRPRSRPRRTTPSATSSAPGAPPTTFSTTGLPAPSDVVTKPEIVASLEESRRRTLGLLAPVPDAAQRGQVSELMSPLCWDLAHIGHYEELWLLRELAGAAPTDAAYDDVYDAFKHPRRDRPRSTSSTPTARARSTPTCAARASTSSTTLELDDGDPLLAGGFVYGMVVQHEHQHDETLLATLQLMDDFAHPAADGPDEPSHVPSPTALPPDVLVPGGAYELGTDTDPWAYDNERPAHVVELAPVPHRHDAVTNAAYAAVRRGGRLRRPAHWTEAGWAWRKEAELLAPQFWRARRRRRLGAAAVRAHRAGPARRAGAARVLVRGRRVRPVVRRAPADRGRVGGRGAGQLRSRAPTSGTRVAGSHLLPCARPTRWRARTARAGCWAACGSGPRPTSPRTRASGPSPTASTPRCSSAPTTRCCAAARGRRTRRRTRTTFRNWDFPIRRQIFSGFRCATDA